MLDLDAAAGGGGGGVECPGGKKLAMDGCRGWCACGVTWGLALGGALDDPPVPSLMEVDGGGGELSVALVSAVLLFCLGILEGNRWLTVGVNLTVGVFGEQVWRSWRCATMLNRNTLGLDWVLNRGSLRRVTEVTSNVLSLSKERKKLATVA